MISAAPFFLLKAAHAFIFSGLNVNGLESSVGTFGPDKTTTFPGVLGTDYYIPLTEHYELYTNFGSNLIRLPFAWERLIPNLNSESPSLDVEYTQLLDTQVAAITMDGSVALVTMNNYGRYWIPGSPTSTSNVIGDGIITGDMFVNSWKIIIDHFKGKENVAFSLMNRPHHLPNNGIVYVAAVIEIIRYCRQTSENYIFVDGLDWSGAHYWIDNNPTAFAGLIGANLTNVVFSVHQFFDRDMSGGSADCSVNVDPLALFGRFTRWLYANNQRAFLATTGVTPSCLPVLRAALDYMEKNSDVWVGFAYYSAGPNWQAWNLPFFYVETQGVVGGPQLSLLSEFHGKGLPQKTRDRFVESWTSKGAVNIPVLGFWAILYSMCYLVTFL